MTLRLPRRRRRLGRLTVFVFFALAFGSSLAQPSPALDRVSIWLGAYDAHADTRIGAGDRNGQYSGDFNLEKDLGFSERKGVPRARLDFLIGDSQRVSRWITTASIAPAARAWAATSATPATTTAPRRRCAAN
jgi:hypothetical protein